MSAVYQIAGTWTSCSTVCASYNKENIIAPDYWSFEGNPHVIGWFPSQRISNAKSKTSLYHDVIEFVLYPVCVSSFWDFLDMRQPIYAIMRIWDFEAGIRPATLHWRHNDHGGVSNHQPHDCLLNRLFRRRSKKTSMLRVTGLCAGNSPGTGEFPAQRASNAENVSIWWRHHEPPCWLDDDFSVTISMCNRSFTFKVVIMGAILRYTLPQYTEVL